jgi:hypothetical protein
MRAASKVGLEGREDLEPTGAVAQHRNWGS